MKRKYLLCYLLLGGLASCVEASNAKVGQTEKELHRFNIDYYSYIVKDDFFIQRFFLTDYIQVPLDIIRVHLKEVKVVKKEWSLFHLLTSSLGFLGGVALYFFCKRKIGALKNKSFFEKIDNPFFMGYVISWGILVLSLVELLCSPFNFYISFEMKNGKKMKTFSTAPFNRSEREGFDTLVKGLSNIIAKLNYEQNSPGSAQAPESF